MMVAGQEYTISLAASNMIAEISSRTTSAKHINSGVRDPWNPPLSSRSVTFLFDPENAQASYKVPARGKVYLTFLASASSGDYLSNGITVSFIYEKGDSQDAKDVPLPPSGVKPPPTGADAPPKGGIEKPPISGPPTNPPVTGGPTGLFNVAGGGPPAFDSNSWVPEEAGSGKMTVSGNSLVFEVPQAGPGSISSFSKTPVSGDCEIELAYSLVGKEVGTVTLEFSMNSSPDTSANSGITLLRLDQAVGHHYLYFGPKDVPGPPVAVPKSALDSGKMKLVRKGSTWTAFQSDGSGWVEIGKLQADLPKDLYFGLWLDQVKGTGGVKLTVIPSIKRS